MSEALRCSGRSNGPAIELRDSQEYVSDSEGWLSDMVVSRGVARDSLPLEANRTIPIDIFRQLYRRTLLCALGQEENAAPASIRCNALFLLLPLRCLSLFLLVSNSAGWYLTLRSLRMPLPVTRRAFRYRCARRHRHIAVKSLH